MDRLSEAGSAGHRLARPLFLSAILLGSFLLFLVQPMVARMALPRLGGAPAVWNSAMLVYQALLLGGYAYAHALGRVPPRVQAFLHIAVLVIAALWLPIGLTAMQLPARAEPALWVPWLLAASIGPLFFAISAQAPLLQRWYSAATGGRDPYALYAASNAGSFAGLLAYPLLVEPLLALKAQSLLWSSGFSLLALLVAGCAVLLPAHSRSAPHVVHHSPPPGALRVAHWILLALVPSGLMLATSTYLTTDIVAVPLLWVLPLGLYLLSFTIAFAANRMLADVLTKFAPLIILLFGSILMVGNHAAVWFNAILCLTLLFVVAVALHARLYALRPAPDRLTGFYLAMALGGALGGVFAALVAPILFDWTYEYPLLILAAGVLTPQAYLVDAVRHLWSKGARARRREAALAALAILLTVAGLWNPGGVLGPLPGMIAFLPVALLGMLAIGRRRPYAVTLACALFLVGGWHSIELSLSGARTRSYFGVYTVTDLPLERRLAHGTTLHGVELKGALSRMPTTYYVPESGVGRAMEALPALYGPHARVGVVGLGAGTLACYAQPGQRWRFYEIDPAVVHLARDSGAFEFLPQCLPGADIVIGDARLRLAEAAPGSFDLLALDAFSSDAVPMHLLTHEAFATYGRALAPRGLLLVHISNRFLALAPVVESAAQHGGWRTARLVYSPSLTRQAEEATTSDWIAMSRDPAMLERLVARGGAWQRLEPRPGFTGWSDDYASILPVMRALHPELARD